METLKHLYLVERDVKIKKLINLRTKRNAKKLYCGNFYLLITSPIDKDYDDNEFVLYIGYNTIGDKIPLVLNKAWNNLFGPKDACIDSWFYFYQDDNEDYFDEEFLPSFNIANWRYEITKKEIKDNFDTARDILRNLSPKTK